MKIKEKRRSMYYSSNGMYSKKIRQTTLQHTLLKFKIWHRLKVLGEAVPEGMIITKVLMTLPVSYQYFSSAWESTSADQRTLSNLTARLMMEELRGQTRDNPGNSAFTAKTGPKQSKKKSQGNRRTDKVPGKCYKCGKPGHWKRDCRKKGDKSTANTDTRGEAFVGETFAAMTSTSQREAQEWYLDSGASQHMSARFDWFVKYEDIPEPIPVKIGNGEIILAHGKGEIDIFSFNGTEWKRNYLAEVLYVPDLKYNLFSVAAALDKGLELSLNHQKCNLRKNGSVVAMGDRLNNMYRMKFKVLLSQIKEKSAMDACIHVGKREDFQVWHERLAHQHAAQCKKILSQWGIKVEPERNWMCETCALGKMSRKPFSTSQTKTKESGELVHADICGPIEHPLIGRCRYFLLIKNDYSHYSLFPEGEVGGGSTHRRVSQTN